VRSHNGVSFCNEREFKEQEEHRRTSSSHHNENCTNHLAPSVGTFLFSLKYIHDGSDHTF
jgi:hypothetical protein